MSGGTGVPGRGRSFGGEAERYDRCRPGYPDALISDVLACARRRRPRILEAGAGTGIATRQLAVHGAEIVGIEPDAAMAGIARDRTVGLAVEIEVSDFEGCQPPSGGFDLVVSAQAWQWIDWRKGASVALRALGRQGCLCLWWNRPRQLVGPGWDAIHAAYERHAPALHRRDQIKAQVDRENRLDDAPGFGPWQIRRYDWEARYRADDYADLLRTHSDHIALPGLQRDQLMAAVRAAIDDTPDRQITYDYTSVLFVARPG